jgi:hypothetical protein
MTPTHLANKHLEVMLVNGSSFSVLANELEIVHCFVDFRICMFPFLDIVWLLVRGVGRFF